MSIYTDPLTLPGVDRRAAIGLIGQAVEAECMEGRPHGANIAPMVSVLTAVAILGATDDHRETVAEDTIRMRILHKLHVDPTNGG